MIAMMMRIVARTGDSRAAASRIRLADSSAPREMDALSMLMLKSVIGGRFDPDDLAMHNYLAYLAWGESLTSSVRS